MTKGNTLDAKSQRSALRDRIMNATDGVRTSALYWLINLGISPYILNKALDEGERTDKIISGRGVRTHDLTKTDYSYRPIDDGLRGHISCWHAITPDMKPNVGDYLILRNEGSTSRYQILTFDPCLTVDPPTMWMANLMFVPRLIEKKD